MTEETVRPPVTIPCLSCWQPWASLFATGKKRIETRSWPCPVLPTVLAVHATSAIPLAVKQFLLSRKAEPFRQALRELGFAAALEGVEAGRWGLPLGCVLGLVRVVRCRPTEDLLDEQRAPLTARERAFGDYANGRWAWVCDRFAPFARPIPAKGGQKVWRWTVPADRLAVVTAALQVCTKEEEYVPDPRD